MRTGNQITRVATATIYALLVVTIAIPVNIVKAQGILEEVIVSARKREENLQETPLSVVAFSGESLEKLNVADLSDLNNKLPNVFIGAGGGFGTGNANFSIRGMGADRNAVNQESATALYIDDAYVSRSDGALLNVLDVERIEVLRGPQGTLFGRNATAGAIRYISKKPTNEFEGSIQATFGSDDRIDVRAIINMPLSDAFAIRVTAATLNQDGFQENAIGQDLGDRGTEIIRSYFRWDASENLEILASVDYTHTDINGGANTLFGVNPNALLIGLAAGPPGGFLDPTQDIIGSTTHSSSITPAFYESDNVGASLTLNWDVNDAVAMKSVTTYREFDINSQFDFDGAAAIILENQDVNRDAEMYSQELQVSGTSFNDRFNWVAGAFYYNEEANDSRISATLGVQGTPGGTTRVNNPHEIESIAVFGQGTYDFTDRFSITGGIRWTRDEKDLIATELTSAGAQIGFLPTDVNGNTGPLIITANDDWSAISGRLSLEFQATEEIFLFTSYARGFRAGALNDRPRANFDVATQADPSVNYGLNSVDPEKIDVFEIGMRSDLLDSRLRVNATVFYQDLKDFQTPRQVPTVGNATITLLENAAGAEAYGLEAEIVYLVNENFSIDANFGLMDSEITEVDPGVGLDIGTALGNAPSFKYNIGGEYGTEAFNGGELSLRLDYAWTDDYHSNPGRDLRVGLDSYGLLNGNITYTAPGNNWIISAYGNNLTDEEYFTQALNFETIVLGYSQATPGRGIEGGVKIEYRF